MSKALGLILALCLAASFGMRMDVAAQPKAKGQKAGTPGKPANKYNQCIVKCRAKGISGCESGCSRRV